MTLEGIVDLRPQLTQVTRLRSDATAIGVVPESHKETGVLAGGYLKDDLVHSLIMAFRYSFSSQPLRKVGFTYLLASTLLVKRRFLLSQLSLPGTRKAMTPSIIHST